MLGQPLHNMQISHIYDLQACRAPAAQQGKESWSDCVFQYSVQSFRALQSPSGGSQSFGHWCKCWSSLLAVWTDQPDWAFLPHRGHRQVIPNGKLHSVNPHNHILFDRPFRTVWTENTLWVSSTRITWKGSLYPARRQYLYYLVRCIFIDTNIH